MTPEPIVSLPYRPCVGIMLVNHAGHVFVGQRIDSPTDAWQMPQGGVDPGEDLKDAALRELGEETGLSPDHVQIEAVTTDWVTYELPADLIGKLWNGRYRGQKQKWFLMRFAGDDSAIRIDTDHPEFSAWRWLPPGQLVDAIVPFKRDVYRAVLAEFGEKI